MHVDITTGLPNVPTENLNMHPAQREFMNSTEKESEEEIQHRHWIATEKWINAGRALPKKPSLSNTALFFEVIRQVQKDFVWVAATMLAWQSLTGGISAVLIAK